MQTSEFKTSVSPTIGTVSCISLIPENAAFMIILGHGAGAGMRHPFMKKLAEELADQNIATLRYQFPYMENGRKRTDKPEVAYETIQAVLKEAKKRYPGLLLFLGGKSYGGRMSSQAMANNLLADIKGIIFYGFPLPAAGMPSVDRGDHLFRVMSPMLFCQGTNDKLADINLIRELVGKLTGNASLYIVEGGDHSFNVPKSLNIPSERIKADLALATREWMDKIAS